MTLSEATKALHHASEQHPVGQAMSNGTISEQWWADWLWALWVVHKAVDPLIPEEFRRFERIKQDLKILLPVKPRDNKPAYEFVKNLPSIDGVIYTFTGAHLMGGAVMAKRLSHRLPCNHLQWEDRQKTIQLWKPYREKVEEADSSKECFAAIIRMMDFIQQYDK
jgi:hypothetical protein